MAEMTAAEAIELLKNRTPAWLGPAMFYITERESQRIAAIIEQQQQKIEQAEAQCKRMKDLHRSILWFVEEHKKIKNCKKWMPLIEEKAKAALEDKP